jgi:hypothetical protein
MNHIGLHGKPFWLACGIWKQKNQRRIWPKMSKTEIHNELCPLRKFKNCDLMCAWRIDAGCSLKVVAVAQLTSRDDELTKLRAARDRHVQNAIMRICPDCGEDMGGDEHRTCWKCKYLTIGDSADV